MLIEAVQGIQESLLRNALDAERGDSIEAVEDIDDTLPFFGSELDELLVDDNDNDLEQAAALSRGNTMGVDLDTAIEMIVAAPEGGDAHSHAKSGDTLKRAGVVSTTPTGQVSCFLGEFCCCAVCCLTLLLFRLLSSRVPPALFKWRVCASHLLHRR